MTPMPVDPVVDAAVRGGLALLFAAAAAHKLRDPRRFRGVVAAYALVPPALVTLASAALVAAELAIAGALVARRGAGLAGGAALLVLYAVALAANLVRGRRELDCGCVGIAGRAGISWWLVARNLVLAALAVAASGTPIARPLVWVDALTVVGAVGALLAVYVAVDGLVAGLPAVARARGTA